MFHVKLPDTQCPACQITEARGLGLLVLVTREVYERCRRPNAIELAGRSFAVALGRREPSWYERHASAYIESGDELELARMLRHVSR